MTHYRRQSKIMPMRSRIVDLLTYNPTSGVFVWRVSRPGIKGGSIAGNVNKDGYIRISIDGVSFYAHRLAWLYMTGHEPPLHIDHRNNNKSDNSWRNLRLSVNFGNHHNIRKPITNKSGYKGVSFDKATGKWRAQIKSGNLYYHLGLFSNPRDAWLARIKATIKLHKLFARF